MRGLGKDKRLGNRAYFVTDKGGIVRFRKIMETPREILPVGELKIHWKDYSKQTELNKGGRGNRSFIALPLSFRNN